MDMTQKSAEEVQKEYRAKLGESFGDVFYRVESEYLWLYRKWKEYELLFLNDRYVALLNAAEGGFWEDVRRALHENILLHICVLTDSPGSKQAKKPSEKPRLTVRQLPGGCRRKRAKRGTQRRIENLEKELKPFRRWRNERIAHRALPDTLNVDEKGGLRPPTREATKRVMQGLHEVLNVVREVELETATVEQPVLCYQPRARAFMAHLSGLVETMHGFTTLLGLEANEQDRIRRARAVLSRAGYTDPLGRSTPHELILAR